MGWAALLCAVWQLLLITQVAAGLHLSTEVPICAGSETLCDSFRDKKDWCYFNGRSQSSDFFFFFQSGKKIHFRWICSRQSNLTFLKGNRLSVRQVFFSVLQSGSLKIITHDWKSCSCVLNFPFFNSSPPSIFDAKQPNVGNCYSLGDTEGFQMVFMFLGTAEIWLISFSRNSGIIIISFFFPLYSYEKQVCCSGGREQDEEGEAGKRRWIYSDFIFISASQVKFYALLLRPAGFNHFKRTLFIKCLFQAVSNPSAPSLFSIVSKNIGSPGGLWIASESR